MKIKLIDSVPIKPLLIGSGALFFATTAVALGVIFTQGTAHFGSFLAHEGFSFTVTVIPLASLSLMNLIALGAIGAMRACNKTAEIETPAAPTLPDDEKTTVNPSSEPLTPHLAQLPREATTELRTPESSEEISQAPAAPEDLGKLCLLSLERAKNMLSSMVGAHYYLTKRAKKNETSSPELQKKLLQIKNSVEVIKEHINRPFFLYKVAIYAKRIPPIESPPQLTGEFFKDLSAIIQKISAMPDPYFQFLSYLLVQAQNQLIQKPEMVTVFKKNLANQFAFENIQDLAFLFLQQLTFSPEEQENLNNALGYSVWHQFHKKICKTVFDFYYTSLSDSGVDSELDSLEKTGIPQFIIKAFKSARSVSSFVPEVMRNLITKQFILPEIKKLFPFRLSKDFDNCLQELTPFLTDLIIDGILPRIKEEDEHSFRKICFTTIEKFQKKTIHSEYLSLTQSEKFELSFSILNHFFDELAESFNQSIPLAS